MHIAAKMERFDGTLPRRVYPPNCFLAPSLKESQLASTRDVYFPNLNQGTLANIGPRETLCQQMCLNFGLLMSSLEEEAELG